MSSNNHAQEFQRLELALQSARIRKGNFHSLIGAID